MTSALTRWLIAVLSCLSAVSWSQEPANSQPLPVQNVLPAINTQVRNAEVLSVSGPVLVMRLENARVGHFFVSQNARFNIDGRSVSLEELKPGMRLTDTITTLYTPDFAQPAEPSQALEAEPVTTPRIASRQASPLSSRLPATATPLPLLGLVGLASVVGGLVYRHAIKDIRTRR